MRPTTLRFGRVRFSAGVASTPTSPRGGTKIALVIELLQRGDGANSSPSVSPPPAGCRTRRARDGAVGRARPRLHSQGGFRPLRSGALGRGVDRALRRQDEGRNPAVVGQSRRPRVRRVRDADRLRPTRARERAVVDLLPSAIGRKLAGARGRAYSRARRAAARRRLRRSRPRAESFEKLSHRSVRRRRDRSRIADDPARGLRLQRPAEAEGDDGATGGETPWPRA